MIRYLFAWLCACLATSFAVAGAEEIPTAVAGTQVVSALAREAVGAYQAGDRQSWDRTVCRSPLSEWGVVRRLVGDISNIRLVLVAGPSDAGNLVLGIPQPTIVYQVTASKYPLQELLLKFGVYDDATCLGISY